MWTNTSTPHDEQLSPSLTAPAASSWRGYLVPAHGGAGTSTLAAHSSVQPLLSEASAALAIADTRASDLAYVIVAAATAEGTGRAVKCLHRLELGHINAGHVELVLVRDGRGPMPVAARARLRLLSSVVAGITVVPHVLRWRYETLDRVSSSRRFDGACDALARRITARHPLGPAGHHLAPNLTRFLQTELALGDNS